MSKLYGDDHRALQDMFDSRKLADRIEEIAVKTEITDEERPFIESRDMFFLATTDHKGRPTVSYKGGDGRIRGSAQLIDFYMFSVTLLNA